MGRQTNFFMNKDDLDNFIIFLRDQNDCLIKAEAGENLGPMFVSESEYLTDFRYYIYNTSYKISFEYFEHDRELTLRTIEKFPLKDREELTREAEKRFKRFGYVRSFDSEVIEVITSKIIENEKQIMEGRIYVELYDFDENDMKYKRSEALESMYVKYSKYIKKNFKISKDKYYYIGPGAYELYKKGWWMGDHRKRDERLRILF